MKNLLALPALLLAANTWASCPAQLPQEAPVIPNGQTAGIDEMHATREAVSHYVAGVEAYLDCRSTNLHPLLHNRAVHLAETTADSWNNALHTFQARENMLATN